MNTSLKVISFQLMSFSIRGNFFHKKFYLQSPLLELTDLLPLQSPKNLFNSF